MEQKKEIPYYFEPKKVGEDLTEVALELLNVENQQVESRWYHSQFETDLFIWSDKAGKIIKQQITFFGQVVEWNFYEGLRTGVILEDEVASIGVKPSEVIHFDQLPSKSTVKMAVEIVEHIKNIKPDLRSVVILNFNTVKKLISKPGPGATGFMNRLRALFNKK